MRKRNLFMSAAIALAGMFGVGSVGSATTMKAQAQEAKKDFNGVAKQTKINHRIVNEAGGLNLVNVGGGGMSPKQYGMIVGSGGKRKSNRLRYSHNAKVKKRKNNAC